MLTKVLRVLDKVLDIWIVAMLCIILWVVIAHIICRFILRYPFYWSIEVIKHCFINIVYIGAAIALRDNRHIQIGIVQDRLPYFPRKYVSFVIDGLIFFLLIILVYSAYQVLLICKGTTPSLTLPIQVHYAPIFVGSILLVVYFILSLVKKGLFKRKNQC